MTTTQIHPEEVEAGDEIWTGERWATVATISEQHVYDDVDDYWLIIFETTDGENVALCNHEDAFISVR